MAAFDDRAVSTYISPPLLPQAIVHELIASGGFEPNLERVVGLLRARRDAMLDALERELPGTVTWSHPEGGYFLWVDFGDGVDAAALLRRAPPARGDVREGRRLLPATARGWRRPPGWRSASRRPERIREGVALLASVL